MAGLTVGEAAERAGWSPRMLRYLERFGLVVPRRTGSGYRQYGLRELRRLYGLDLAELVFARRLRREPDLERAVHNWLAAADDAGSWVEWEQRKHERLLAA